ncbi:MAG: hypothetical protein JWP37_2075 [Mucilaginibacter sp.]|nr:hypothetical protein [Mucilaginibacter sp.]
MKTFFTTILLLSTMLAFAQSNSVIPNISKTMLHQSQNKTANKDTVIEKDTSKENKEPRNFYISANTNVFVNSRGGAAKRFSPSVEFGRTYGIFDIGLATGRLNSLNSGGDTTRFLEFRPTINIFSKGRFAEALCLGGGYVLKAKQGMMTEICNSINFNISETVAVAVLQGYYFFDGTNSSRSTQYMGFSFTYNFLKKHSVNMQRKKKSIINDN